MVKHMDDGREAPTTVELPEGFVFPVDSKKEDLERLERELVNDAVRRKLVSLSSAYFD